MGLYGYGGGLNRHIGESAGEQWMREHGMGDGYTSPVFAQISTVNFDRLCSATLIPSVMIVFTGVMLVISFRELRAIRKLMSTLTLLLQFACCWRGRTTLTGEIRF